MNKTYILYLKPVGKEKMNGKYIIIKLYKTKSAKTSIVGVPCPIDA